MKILFYDLETTGIDYTKDAIIQFAGILINLNEINNKVEILDKYCNKYNNVDKILLCGYNNLHFDNDFLRQWFIDNGDTFFGSWFWSNAIDVMSEAGLYFMHYRPAMTNFKLGSIAKFLNIETDDSALHDGFYDIKLTMKIFLTLIKEPKIKMWDEIEAERLFNIKLELDKLPKPIRKESEYIYM